MFATRCLASTSPAIRRAVSNNNNNKLMMTSRFSSSSSPLAGDTGKKATHLHHHMTTLLALSTPIYFLTPSSMTDGIIDKSFGIVLASTISAHSWIGLNYVATDYVPKISKALIGPARIFNAVLCVVTFVGLSKIALNDRGGIKGMIMGLWRPVSSEENKKEE